MKTNIKDLNFIVASFLKYCYQERKDVYMEDINMFIDFLTNNNIVALETDDLNSFFDNNQDIFSIDFDDKIVLNDQNRMNNLMELKKMILDNNNIDTLGNLQKRISEMQKEISDVRLEQIRQRFMEDKEKQDINLMSFYIYIYKNYEDKNIKDFSIVEHESKTYLKRQNIRENGLQIYGEYAFELIPDLNQNNEITKKSLPTISNLKKPKTL